MSNTEILLTNKTKSSNALPSVTDSNGLYATDALNFNTGYDFNDSVSVEAYNSFRDEYKKETFTITGTQKTQNIQTEVISSLQKGTTGYPIQNILVNVNSNPFTSDNRFPVETKTDRRYKTKTTYTANGFEEYHGEASPGSLTSSSRWRISKRVYDSDDRETDLVWANGDAEFNKIWDNRASYNYS